MTDETPAERGERAAQAEANLLGSVGMVHNCLSPGGRRFSVEVAVVGVHDTDPLVLKVCQVNEARRDGGPAPNTVFTIGEDRIEWAHTEYAEAAKIAREEL